MFFATLNKVCRRSTATEERPKRPKWPRKGRSHGWARQVLSMDFLECLDLAEGMGLAVREGWLEPRNKVKLVLCWVDNKLWKSRAPNFPPWECIQEMTQSTF